MKHRKAMSRLALARRLHSLALSLAADRPIRVGRKSARIPNRLMVEQEIETTRGEIELEIEITWPNRAKQMGLPFRGKKHGARRTVR